MRVAEHVDGDAAHEVEIARAVGRDEPGALASLEGKVDPLVGGQKMCGAHGTFFAASLK